MGSEPEDYSESPDRKAYTRHRQAMRHHIDFVLQALLSPEETVDLAELQDRMSASYGKNG